MMYRKILVPYDKCEAADKALDHALMLARFTGSEVNILHVIPEILLPATMTRLTLHSIRTGEEVSSREYLKELYQEMKGEALKMLEDVAEKGRRHAREESAKDKDKKAEAPTKLRPIKIRTKVMFGRPQDKIIEYAKHEDIDLIVIGNVCLTGLSRIKSLGSVSREVSEKSPCPVLIVH